MEAAEVSDFQAREYLLSHAPLDRFYLFVPRGSDETLVKFFDEDGQTWNLMEDDDDAVARAVAFLKHAGVKTFDDYADLLEYERSHSAPTQR